MTGAEHYREANQLLSAIVTVDGGVTAKAAELAIQAAQVHATLALVAATCAPHDMTMNLDAGWKDRESAPKDMPWRLAE